jgi:hypothetical protein
MWQIFDAVKLIKSINGLTYQFESQTYHTHTHSLHQAKKRLYTFYQGKGTTNTKFLDMFQIRVSVVQQYGREVAKDPGAIKSELEINNVIKSAKDTYLDVDMLSAADKSSYGKVTEDLENDFRKGHNNYPTNVRVAYNLIIN